MSAFVVREETISKVLCLLDLDNYELRSTGKVFGDEADKLGQQLWQLNADAVAFRYQDHAPEVLSEFHFNSSFSVNSVCALLKAAHCWMYQCSEGEQFTTHDLFKCVEEKVQRVESAIVGRLPQYEAAAWG
jgi:hypothetical protein